MAADWREAMRVLALRTRTVLLKHSWVTRAAWCAPAPDQLALPERALAALSVLDLSFTRFSQAVQEDAFSRLWLGVHYNWDAIDGLALGDNVAGYLFANTMRPTD